jgi:ribosome-associated protein
VGERFWVAFPAMAERLRVTGSCSVALDELEWRFSASGGPGGQHANTANTRVELLFDVARSRSLGPRQRARILERLGPVVRIVASERRSQSRNRDIALDRLRSRLAAALARERPRVATRPTRAARAARVDDKRRRGEIKRGRSRPRPED